MLDLIVAKHAGTASFRWDGSSLGTNWQSAERKYIRAGDLRNNPRIEIRDPSNKLIEVHYLGAGCQVRESFSDSQEVSVQPGHILADSSRMPVLRHATTRAEKITRLEELLLLRRPQYAATLAPADGRVTQIKKQSHGRYALYLETTDGPHKVRMVNYRIFFKSPGDTVQRGDLLTGGTPTPSDLLRYRGFDEAVRYLCDEIKWLFRPGRIEISEQHVELIAAQMLNRVRVTDAGDSNLPLYAIVNRSELIRSNQELASKSDPECQVHLAKGEPVFTSLAKVSPSSAIIQFGEGLEINFPWSQQDADLLQARLGKIGTGQRSLRSARVEIQPPAPDLPTEFPVLDLSLL